MRHLRSVLCALLLIGSVLCADFYQSCDARAKRSNCGYVGSTEESCTAAGCCWSPIYYNPENVPWCFYPNAAPTPVQPTPTACYMVMEGGEVYTTYDPELKREVEVVEPLLGPTWMGSESGTLFGVWAPHAAQVWVNGTFGQTQEMVLCEEGFWGTMIASAAPGDSYTYIIQYNGVNYTRVDPVAREVVQVGNQTYVASVIHNPDSFNWNGTKPPFPEHFEQVIYEMQVPTFNPNSTNGIGTFEQAIQKLDYLVELGINVVEPLPLVSYPGPARDWGYNPGVPYTIMEAFGGYDGMKNFVYECNKRGIAVYMDIVWNHMGSPCVLWQYDGWHQAYPGFPNLQVPGGIYFYENWNANTEWGPRPNFANSTVRRYIVNNLRTFMKELHVSGFRYDSTICIRKGAEQCWYNPNNNVDGEQVLKQATTAVQALGGFNIAEDLQTDSMVTTPVDQGGLGFQAQWSDSTWYALQDVLGNQDDSTRNIQQYADAILALNSGNYGGNWRVLYTENHDKSSGQNEGQGRWPVIVDSSDPTSYIAQKLSALGIVTVLTSPGVPMLFYGQEFLDTEDFTYGDVPNLPWSQVGTWENGMWTSIGPYNGFFNMTKTLVGLRMNANGNTPELQTTNTNVYWQSQSDLTIAFTRGENQTVVVLVNCKSKSYSDGYNIGVPYAGTWTVGINTDLTAYSSVFGNVGAGVTSLQTFSTPNMGFQYSVSVPLGAYSAWVLIYQG